MNDKSEYHYFENTNELMDLENDQWLLTSSKKKTTGYHVLPNSTCKVALTEKPNLPGM